MLNLILTLVFHHVVSHDVGKAFILTGDLG